MREKDRIKLRVGNTVTVKLITQSVVTGKVVRRDNKIMISCKEVFYHFNSVVEVIKVLS